jgi:hypothetical protein
MEGLQLTQSNNALKTKEVKKASKIRIYPNKETRQYFEHCLRDNHIAYNYFVERDKADYEQYKAGEMWGYLELFENTNIGKYCTEMKNNGYFSGESDSRIKNYTVKVLEAAKFISNGFPQFKNNIKTVGTTGTTFGKTITG